MQGLARFMVWLLPAFLAVLGLAESSAFSEERTVRVPLRFDHAFIREALVAQVFTSATGKAVLWDDGTGCNFLKLREPAVRSEGARLHVRARAEVRAGTRLGATCLAPIQWEGWLEIEEEPVLRGDGRALRFEVVNSGLYDDGSRAWIAGRVWNVLKEQAEPRFEAVEIDLQKATADLQQLLPLFLPRQEMAQLERMLSTLQFARAAVSHEGVEVDLTLRVPLVEPRTPAPEPTLSPEELARWQEAVDRWDAFLTYTVKFVWADSLIHDLRQPLAEVLLEGRYDILEALAPSEPSGPDPVPALFVRTWKRLAPVLRQIAARQPGAEAIRYMSFIQAGDALAALQEIGPAVGLDLTADGLRRLARMIAPADPTDPLRYDTAVDPQLRTLLGFGPPLPPPDLGGMPVSWWQWWIAPAWAADRPPQEVLAAWLATPDNLPTYLPRVRSLLDEVAGQAVQQGEMSEEFQPVYRNIVFATAWQESCWRQFVREGGQITYIRSAVGSSGLMQVNERVWRGIYDLRGIRWDIRYNARAGAEIARHYLLDYAIARGEHKQPGGLDNLARATYAVYNGGPGHLARHRRPNTKAALKKIDTLFWEKYQAVRDGRTMEVARCLGGEPPAASGLAAQN